MFSIIPSRVSAGEANQRLPERSHHARTNSLALFRTAATRVVHQVITRVALMERFSSTTPSMTRTVSPAITTTHPSRKRDILRQALNLFLSVAQFAAATLIFSSQFGDDLFYNPARQDPLIVPADYTFAIWAFIFPSSIAYGVYQALPRQRTNELLRRIGFHTAFAFGCITLWSVGTLFDPLRYTVPLFFGALWALVHVVYHISQSARPLTRSERVFILAPLSVYAAWCTVGTIANTSTSLAGLGYTDLVLGAQSWTVIMLLVGGVISAFMTTVTRGNIPYATGIIWAFIGIVVASVTERPNMIVATTAGIMATFVGLALLRARLMSQR